MSKLLTGRRLTASSTAKRRSCEGGRFTAPMMCSCPNCAHGDIQLIPFQATTSATRTNSRHDSQIGKPSFLLEIFGRVGGSGAAFRSPRQCQGGVGSYMCFTSLLWRLCFFSESDPGPEHPHTTAQTTKLFTLASC